jgi:hypothetical protein
MLTLCLSDLGFELRSGADESPQIRVVKELKEKTINNTKVWIAHMLDSTNPLSPESYVFEKKDTEKIRMLLVSSKNKSYQERCELMKHLVAIKERVVVEEKDKATRKRKSRARMEVILPSVGSDGSK